MENDIKLNFHLYNLPVNRLKRYFADLIGEQNLFALGRSYSVYKGDIPIVIVAHTDTIPEHRNAVKKSGRMKSFPPMIQSKDGIVSAPLTGLGADDRAGCSMISMLHKEGLRPWVILTDDEELGCLGSTALAHDLPDGIPVNFMIQLDRRGQNDAVFYDYDTNSAKGFEFVRMIESYGFEEAIGSYSDISVLAPAWNLAAVNLSVGYMNEHTLKECLVIDWFKESYKKVRTLLQDFNTNEALQEVRDYQEKPLRFIDFMKMIQIK